MSLHLKSHICLTEPYEHFAIPGIFESDWAGELTSWLEEKATWRRQRGRFFDQFETRDLYGEGSPFLRLNPLLSEIRQYVERLVQTDLGSHVDVTAHRLVGGQLIGIHNDEPKDDYETHRMIVILPSPGVTGAEGNLLLLDKPSEVTATCVLSYQADLDSNCGLVFALRAGSYHAVTAVTAGVRYSLVFSFWARSVPAVPEPHGKVAGVTCILPMSELLHRLPAACATTDHSRGSLLSDLVGTYELLRRWGCSRDVCLAGLFHSVYGTTSFSGGPLFDSDRNHVVAQIGNVAEELVWAYSRWPTSSEHDRMPRELLWIDIANLLEQAPRIRPSLAEVRYLIRTAAFLQIDIPRKVHVSQPAVRVLPLDPGSAGSVEAELEAAADTFSDYFVRVHSSQGTARSIEVRSKQVAEERHDPWLADAISHVGLSGASSLAIAYTPTMGCNAYMMFNHSMALAVWASLYAGQTKRPRVLVHIDSHSDLGTPTAHYLDEHTYRCSYTGREYRIDDAQDARQLVEDGLVSIGSFIVPALRAGWFDRFVFVSKSNTVLQEGEIILHAQQVPAGPSRSRRVLEAHWDFAHKDVDAELRIPAVKLPYSMLGDYLDAVGSYALDVDLDFFCNKYDRNTGCHCGGACVPNVKEECESFLRQLASSTRKPEVLTIAYSPGFLDSKFWPEVFSESWVWH